VIPLKRETDELTLKTEIEKAIQYYREAAELKPNDHQIYESLALCYILLNKVSFTSHHTLYYFFFSIIVVECGSILLFFPQIPAARTELQKAMELKPDDITIHCLLSKLAYEEKNLDEAFRIANNTLTLDPDNRFLHYMYQQPFSFLCLKKSPNESVIFLSYL
jgi:tetratricopeptide (TPR) repeat protein